MAGGAVRYCSRFQYNSVWSWRDGGDSLDSSQAEHFLTGRAAQKLAVFLHSSPQPGNSIVQLGDY